MLYGIPEIISPELLKILMEMGHGDEIIIADGNFPAASHAQRLVRCEGHNVPEILEAVMYLFPLDTFVEEPIALMEVIPGDHVVPARWDQYSLIINEYFDGFNGFEYVERFDFYNRTKKAYAVIATSDKEQYANIILKKGIITK